MADLPPSGPIRPRYARVQYDILFGVLAVLFAYIAISGPLNADTTGGAIAAFLFGAVLGLAVVAALVYTHRHPAELEIDQDRIVKGSKGLPRSTTIAKADGAELAYHVSGGRARIVSLRQVTTGIAVDVAGFKRKEVEAACRARGWRLAT